MELTKIVDVLKQYCKLADLRRLDQDDKIFEALFVVEMDDTESLQKTRQALLSFDPQLQITFLDNKGSL